MERVKIGRMDSLTNKWVPDIASIKMKTIRYKIMIWSIALLPFLCEAQQIAQADNIQLVSGAGINLVTEGGIKFINATSWVDSGTITLKVNPVSGLANWVDSTAGGVLASNTGTTVFNNNTNTQELIGKSSFYNLTVNGKGINLHQSNEVKSTLALNNGLVYFQSASDSIYVSNPAIAAITSTSSYLTSWVHGKLSRVTNVTGTEYLFPVGKIKSPDSLYAPVKFDKFNTNSATYSVTYFPAIPYQNTNFLNPPLDHISELEYWEIYSNVSGADASAKLSLSWRGYSRVSSFPLKRDSLLIAQYIYNSLGDWEATGGGFAATVTGADSLSGYVKHKSFGAGYTYAERRFTLGTYSHYNALPVHLIYWTAIANINKVRLEWNVQQEQDIRFYEVERSLNGVDYGHLITVPSMQQVASIYINYDIAPATGWNYYRLKLIDRIGRITYAGVRKVKFTDGENQVRIFPNPTTHYLNIQLPTYYTGALLNLYAIDGKLLSSHQVTSSNIQLDVSFLSAGGFVLKIIRNDNEIMNYQFIKQ